MGRQEAGTHRQATMRCAMLKGDLRTTIDTLLNRGSSLREIARSTGVDRKTIRAHIRRKANDHSQPESVATDMSPCPPAPGPAKQLTDSVCEPYREWIETQLRLRRNAQSIYQDLVEVHGFPHKYSAVKRF